MWRLKNGLAEDNIDTNPEKLDNPGMEWTNDRPVNIKERRKADLIKEL